MQERFSNNTRETCVNCPQRTTLSRFIGRMLLKYNTPQECTGPIVVSRGTIITQVRHGYEADPDRGTWNSMTETGRGQFSERRFSRTEWVTEQVCGREAIELREGEQPYDPSRSNPHTDHDGKRYVAFIRGDEHQIRDWQTILAIDSALSGIDSGIEQ